MKKTWLMFCCALLAATAASAGVKQWPANGAGGGGTVTSFSSGNANPLFTTNVANPGSTPTLTFTLDQVPANWLCGGPGSGAPSLLTCRNLVEGDIPSIGTAKIYLSTSLLNQSNQDGFNTQVANNLYSLRSTTGQVCVTQGAGTYTFSLCPPFIVNANSDGGTAPTAPTGNAFQYICQDTTNCTWDIDTFGGSARYLGRAWGGTMLSPTAVGAAVVDGGMAGRAYDGTSMPTVDEAAFQTITTQAQTSTHHGHGCEIVTTANNTTTSHQAVTCYSTGGMTLNDSSGNAPTGGDPGAGAWNVVGNYQVGGVVQPIIQLWSEQRVPLILQSSGTMGNNGALSGLTSMGYTYPNAYMYFAANTICTSGQSTAGMYYVVMSSNTAGTVYNNLYAGGGEPTIPGSPTAFSCTGPGAYTQTTSQVTVFSIPVAGNALGTIGALTLSTVLDTINNADSKTIRVFYGGSQFGSYAVTTSLSGQPAFRLRNLATNSQVAANSILDQSSTGSSYRIAVDSTTSQNLIATLQLGAATDYLTLMVSDTEVKQ